MRRMAIFCSTLVSLVIGGQVFAADPPSEWDWRALNGVTIPKNQGMCGASTTFATIGALESRIMIESGVELDLSEQYVINCAAVGCDGGSPPIVLNFLMDEGVVAESVVPYAAAVQPCPSVSGTRYAIGGWNRVFEHADLVKRALVETGPLIVVIDIYQDFLGYVDGVYHHGSGAPMGRHAMLLVGYSDSGQYWILRNSWGTLWGENGYIRIAYTDRVTMDHQYTYSLGPLDSNTNCDDSDGDGYGIGGDPSCPGGETPDCDDDDPATYPGAEELCDGLDNDCDGTVPEDEFDGDGDGYPICADDCDDNDAESFPGATELCDGIDNDCDGSAEGEADLDDDGFRECDADCDDANPLTYPGATEQCDGNDNDCDGTVPVDELDGDADGFPPCAGDCDDDACSISPSAPEVFDGLDNDCDEAVDEGLDADGDGIPDFNDSCPNTPAGSGVGPDGCAVCIVSADGDGDGILDETDRCPSSDLSAVVVIDNCDSGVANHLLPGGCTIMDEIAACAADATNHGQLVRCVSHLTNRLKGNGIISGREKGAIQSCLRK